MIAYPFYIIPTVTYSFHSTSAYNSCTTHRNQPLEVASVSLNLLLHPAYRNLPYTQLQQPTVISSLWARLPLTVGSTVDYGRQYFCLPYSIRNPPYRNQPLMVSSLAASTITQNISSTTHRNYRTPSYSTLPTVTLFPVTTVTFRTVPPDTVSLPLSASCDILPWRRRRSRRTCHR